MNFDVLKEAGITPGMTAKFCSVSRVTASQWHNGHAKPHHLLTDRVSEYLRLVREAVDQGKLPLKEFPGRKHVFPEISKAIVAARLSKQSSN
jgi:hypothetical protein